MQRVPTSRQSVNLSTSLRRKLDMYGLAAATGLSVAALASNANAEVVFTPAHQQIPVRGGVTIDLNHDGIPDFRLVRAEFGLADSGGLIASSLRANRVLSTGGSRGRVANLAAGYRVGPDISKFKTGGTFSSIFGPAKILFNCADNSGLNSCEGPWYKDTPAGYVGFRFVIKGETHYGWARLRIVVKQPNEQMNVYLTGYAYETVPNKAIVTGKTSGTDDESGEKSAQLAPKSGTLGALSTGVEALPARRRGADSGF